MTLGSRKQQLSQQIRGYEIERRQGRLRSFIKQSDITVYSTMITPFTLPIILMISTQKKIWSEGQDVVLKRLYEEEGMRNWSQIAKKMLSHYSLPRKSAKQCRQRYENHISTEVSKMQWTIEQQLMLIQYHNEMGNKWSQIAQKIPGKSDNCIKNHFYSKLRKILRKLNSVIHTHFRRVFREININVIYKVVEACEEQFKEKPNCEELVSATCREIQNKMLNLSMLKEEEQDSEQRVTIYHDLIKEIYSISKIYKRKNKKSRNNSIQAPNVKGHKKKQVIVVSNNSEQGYASDPSSVFEDGQSFRSGQVKEDMIKNHDFQSEEYDEVQVKPHKKKNDIVVKDEEQGIKDLLKDAGLLQFDNSDVASANGFKFSSRSSFKSYSQNQNMESDQQFFDDSEVEKGFSSNKRNRNYFKNLDDPSDKSEKEGPADFYIQ